MALPSRYGVDKNMNSWAGLSAYKNGGKGSGNFGHAGRPGEVGGSSKEGAIPHNLDEAKKMEKAAEKAFSDYVESHSGPDYDQKIADKLGAEFDRLKDWRQSMQQRETYKKMEEKKEGKSSKGTELSLRGKSLYEKVHMIEAGDEVHITPKDNLPNFDRKIKVDYIQDGTIHYGSSETSDGYTYPAWAIKDITKIIRKKNYIAELKEKIAYLEKLINGGKGSGNFGHSGRPGQVGGSGDGKGVIDEKDETGEAKDGTAEKTGLEKDLYEKKQVKIDRIKEKIGKDIDITADDLSDDPWRDLRYITVTDKDGEEYSYDAISEQVHKRSSGEEMLAPSVKKALADKDDLWKKPSWEIKGQEVKKKLKEYGINTDGLSVSRKSGGYSDAWHISGSGKKTDLKSAERILKDKLEFYERDVSGEILMGGNTFVFVTDTDRNSLKKKETSEYDGEMMMGMPSRYGVDKKINSMEGMSAYENGGPGSGNFGHAGRPGEVGGSSKDGGGMNPNTKIARDLAKQKEYIEKAKQVTKDIEDRIGQKMKEGETYTAFDEAKFSRFKFFHGEDGTEYTYDKIADTITKTNPKTGDQEVVTKQKKDYGSEKSVVSRRDGHQIASEFADLSAELETARTNLKMLKEDKGKAYKDLSGRNTFMDRSSEISRSLHYAEALGKSKMSKETKKLVKEMEKELRSIRDEYDKLGTDKYFDPDLNHEN